MNLRKGLRRLAISLSFLSFPIAYLISLSVLSGRYHFLDGYSLKVVIESHTAFTLGWGILSSIAVWVICRFALFVIEGFQGVKVKQESNVQRDMNARRKLRRIAFAIAIASTIICVIFVGGVIPAVITCGVIWLLVWFAGLIIYRWFVLGFRDEEAS